ncbi:myristylated tegument protein [Beluga whale alphaherpesvirus 1]|uniref:Cytoplasmic envelopment protein 3 n=1 Tax=Beluga whale alphaherpesvirus 1 TaxID=1434720 RepID=A0A286MM70_9ALPH|nr:myristylated tegument protein [Beluga whale alphaherpesvirus 1]ASW27096.1 myristylated tegument protein [Beluga whale alphaherpesvirus 1]
MGQAASCRCCRRRNLLVTDRGEVVALSAEAFEEFSEDDLCAPDVRREQPAPARAPRDPRARHDGPPRAAPYRGRYPSPY